MPEDGGKIERMKKDNRVWKQGVERMGKCKLWMVKRRRKLAFSFVLLLSFRVFINNSAAPELYRSWARDSSEEEEERFVKWPTNRERGEPCCDGRERSRVRGKREIADGRLSRVPFKECHCTSQRRESLRGKESIFAATQAVFPFTCF